MTRRPTAHRRLATLLATATLGLGGAGAAAAMTLGGAPSGAPVPVGMATGAGGLQVVNGASDPCILAIAYAHSWGICIQPPTN